MKIVFVHGWASGPFVWDAMMGAFDGEDCYHVNLGFFGEKDTTMPEGPFIGVGHSLGGLWLLKHYPEQMVGLVSIASFNCFYKHVPKQVLGVMQRNIAKNMTAPLQDFWRHAGLNQPQGLKNLKPAKLIEGLSFLSKWKANIPSNLPMKILASRDDLIVPEKMTMDIWGDHDIKWVQDGGHMLPLTQAEWCIQHVKEFIHDTK